MSLQKFLIALLAGLVIAVTFVGDEPVCYAREQVDDLNAKVQMVPSKENKQSHFKKFASHKDVAITDLLGVRCRYEELPKVFNGYFGIKDCTGRGIKDTCKVTCHVGYFVSSSMVQTTCQDEGNGYAAWSLDDFSCHNFYCSFDEMPKVTNGYINISDCSGNNGSDVCNVTCEKDYYPAIQQTVCKYAGSQKGEWLSRNLSCLAITCSFTDLPSVTNGHFQQSDCSGNSVGHTCNMTCAENYYPPTPEETRCENVGTNQGSWSGGHFFCQAITCSFADLPSVANGQFHQPDCSGNIVGDTCNMACATNYYPRTTKETRCEKVGTNQGSWSSGNFMCQAITCSFTDLPSVANGHFQQSSCSGNSVGHTCSMTCAVNYYTSTPKETRCRNVGSSQGSWSSGNFICQAITCPYNRLPTATHAQFHRSRCSGNRVGDFCEMTCAPTYYSSIHQVTRCQNFGNNNLGTWSSGNFVCPSRCPSGWTVNTRVSGICYKILTNTGTYSQQEAKCNWEHGHLASIHSLDELNEIKALLSGGEYYFIGLNDISREGTWVYSDSTSYDYEYWGTGEPNNSGDGEDCVEMTSSGAWNDTPCSALHKAICQRGW